MTALHSSTGVFRLLDHMSELTSVREQNSLNAALSTIVFRIARADSLALYRVIGSAEDLRWMRCVRCWGGGLEMLDPSSCDFDQLPPLGAYPLRCQALRGEERFAEEGGRFLSVLPLGAGRRTDGVIEVRADHRLEPETLELLRRVLRVYQNQQSLLHYSASDTLTGLLNRKTFDDSFREVTAQRDEPRAEAFAGERRERTRQSFWLAMIDVDRFKRVNDTFGHLIGDEVLLTLSHLMRRTFRALDRLYRFGGEEFAAMIRCRDTAAAMKLFERLRQTVESHPFPQAGYLTVSIGFTAIDPQESASCVLERADKAVYYAKQHGRNQVCCYEGLLARGAVTTESKAGSIELF